MGSMIKVRNNSRLSDSRLWACMIDPLHAAGVADPHTVSRALIAVLRREDPSTPGVRSTGPMERGARTFAPGDEVPGDVLTAYDLDGDVWDRWTDDPSDTMHGSWRMRDYDPDGQDSAAGVYLTPHLLTQYGPLTHLDVPWQGGPRPEDAPTGR